MKTAVALRHVHFEDAGTLAPVLRDHGYQLEYVDPTRDGLDHAAIQRADLLLVLGGPIGASDERRYPFLQDESAVIRQRLDDGKPLLGICLGAQLIAKALGAKVYPLGVKEIGFAPLSLTHAGQASALAALGDAPVLHWHGDQFDVPASAVHLASTPVGVNQAFALGRKVLGLQFHLEADVRRLEPWLVGHAHELDQAGVDPRRLRADALALGDRLTMAARAAMTAWLQQLEEYNNYVDPILDTIRVSNTFK